MCGHDYVLDKWKQRTIINLTFWTRTTRNGKSGEKIIKDAGTVLNVCVG